MTVSRTKSLSSRRRRSPKKASSRNRNSLLPRIQALLFCVKPEKSPKKKSQSVRRKNRRKRMGYLDCQQVRKEKTVASSTTIGSLTTNQRKVLRTKNKHQTNQSQLLSPITPFSHRTKTNHLEVVSARQEVSASQRKMRILTVIYL